MPNLMTSKRDLLKTFLLGVLQNHDADYALEDRLRMATFAQTSRAERIAVMGTDYTYGEILYRPNQASPDERTAGSTSRGRDHQFEIHIWHKFDDDDTYADSSQKVWDDLVEADNGVLKSVENKPYLDDGGGNQYVVSSPVAVSSYEVLMDSSEMELAHYLTFRLTIKG